MANGEARTAQGWIRNPLTVIGVFAGVAEICGTVVLPRLDPELQCVFVWFVMGFPVLLVAAFFLTLNLNPRCLYAPSDYRDESIFSEMMSGQPRVTASERKNEAVTASEAVAEKPRTEDSTRGEKSDG
jgi:hypothetical protein